MSKRKLFSVAAYVKRKLSSVAAYIRGHIIYFKILMVFLSVGIPLIVLFCLYPASFDRTFNGRAYYMFFVWLLVLEFALDWDKYGPKIPDRPLRSKIAFGIAFALPTCYVIASNFFGLNGVISELTRWSGIISPTVADYAARLEFMPLATEFIAFAVLFAVVILCMYRLKGLKDFLLPIAMLVAIGAISMINLLFPFGNFTPFQILVPATTTLAAGILNLMGYHTYVMGTVNYTPTLLAYNSTGQWGAQIAWPCAGVDSLIIYTVVILLFMKKATIPRLHKAIYFVIGAAVTYFINILRIVLIFVIGVNGGDVWFFHDNYAQLLSITWIVCYPLIIIGSRVLWSKLKHRNSSSDEPIAKLNSSTADLASS
jgi:exosortase/archaeosortase family protein